jgi:lipoate-protein ligase A
MSQILNNLQAVLTGVPADLSTAAIMARVRAAIPLGYQLTDTSIEALSRTLAESIPHDAAMPCQTERIGTYSLLEVNQRTAAWRGHDWQLIPETPCSPQENIALDEVLSNRVATGQRPPTLRFWVWDQPAIVLGRCQSVRNEVDSDAAAEAGFAIARRMSGGGAMIVTPTGTITYSLYLPESLLAGLSIRQSYEICDAWAVQALRSLGVDAHYVPVNDIACGQGKIAGAAQARRNGVVLHHTTLAYDINTEGMARLLRLGKDKPNPRGVPSAAKVVWPIRRQSDHTRDSVVHAMIQQFQASYGLNFDTVTAEEWSEVCSLVESRYGTHDWLYSFA